MIEEKIKKNDFNYKNFFGVLVKWYLFRLLVVIILFYIKCFIFSYKWVKNLLFMFVLYWIDIY